jgi:hypothetical protein
MSTSTHTNGVHHAPDTDAGIDSLYSFWPGQPPAAPPCPEALFSPTLKGKLDGIETLLTVRGMTSAEFQHNLQSVRGLLDAPPAPQAPASPLPAGDMPRCPAHGFLRKGKRGWYCPVKLQDGSWCPSTGQ